MDNINEMVESLQNQRVDAPAACSTVKLSPARLLTPQILAKNAVEDADGQQSRVEPVQTNNVENQRTTQANGRVELAGTSPNYPNASALDTGHAAVRALVHICCLARAESAISKMHSAAAHLVEVALQESTALGIHLPTFLLAIDKLVDQERPADWAALLAARDLAFPEWDHARSSARAAAAYLQAHPGPEGEAIIGLQMLRYHIDPMYVVNTWLGSHQGTAHTQTQPTSSGAAGSKKH
jgi:hypothetical protein